MALIDYNNGTATISVNGGQPPFSYLLKQGGVAATHDGANFVNPIISSNQSVVFGDSSDLTGSYGMPSGTYTCEITDNNGCIVTTSEIVISQTEEATTTMATAATTLATAATTLATIPTTPATDATTLATAATTLATDATTIAPVEYELVTAYLNRDEGQSAFFELQYNNVTPGTTVGFTLSGTATPAFEMGGMIEPMDYTEPTDMFFTTGTSGFVILEIPINEDQQTEGAETIILTLDAQDSDGNPTGSLQKTVTINDTSELQNWEIAASTHDEGITFNHILNTEHAPAGTEYYWYVSVAIGFPHSPASAADFVGGVVPSGSGTIPAYNETLSQSAVIPISIVADSLTEGDEVYQIIVKEGSPSNPGTLRVIQMMTITDSSVPATTLATAATTLAPTYTTFTGPATRLEGQTVSYVLNGTNIPDGTQVGYTITGVDLSDISLSSLTGFITMNNFMGNQQAGQLQFSCLDDNNYEGSETMVVTLNNQDEAGNTTGLTPTLFIETIISDLATTTLPTFTCDDANFTVNTGVVDTGVSATSVGVPTSIVPAHYVLGVSSYTAQITVPATDAWGTAYSNAGGSIECAAVGVGIVATTLATDATTNATAATTIATDATTNATAATTEATDATTNATAAPLEHTFYHLHAGGTTYPYTDLGGSAVGYAIGDTTYTQYNMGVQSDFDFIMADVINNGDGSNNSPNTQSFEFAGPITGSRGCDPTWDYVIEEGELNWYYLAVPDNADFNVDLVSGGLLQQNCTGTYNASSRKPFTYNGESYWLYKMQNAQGNTAKQFGFK